MTLQSLDLPSATTTAKATRRSQNALGCEFDPVEGHKANELTGGKAMSSRVSANLDHNLALDNPDLFSASLVGHDRSFSPGSRCYPF
jgi:hypothetical protein